MGSLGVDGHPGGVQQAIELVEGLGLALEIEDPQLVVLDEKKPVIVVERHGGTIKAVSAPDDGATFCFELPVEAP